MFLQEMLNYSCAKTHERFLHRAEQKDGLCFRKCLWLRGTAFTCSCSIKSTTYSLFTPHSTLVIEASCTFSPLPSPKGLGMLPVDAIFTGRKRHCEKGEMCLKSPLPAHVIPPTDVIGYFRYLHVRLCEAGGILCQA